MSSKKFSPAARLLRKSKLFSVPAPLPVKGKSGLDRYPRHQAITAPTSSLSRGDWGLKRNLPSKILGEHMRYDELDNIEHRTTFDSAADYVYALKKWQEMGLAVHQRNRSEGSNVVSAFTDGNAWGSRRPFLQELEIPEARAYIKEHIAPRREAFLRFLARIQMHQQMIEKTKGMPVATNQPKELTHEDKIRKERNQRRNEMMKRMKRYSSVSTEITPERLAEVVVSNSSLSALRRDHYHIVPLVRLFLNLPRFRPFQTHPSAGLYYELKQSYLANDWEHGPGWKKPYIGRDLGSSVYSNFQRLVALGGFVANTKAGTSSVAPAVLTRWQPMELQPSSAEIDNAGRIHLSVLPTGQAQATQQIAGILGDWDAGTGAKKKPDVFPMKVNRELQRATKAVDTNHLGTALKQLLETSLPA